MEIKEMWNFQKLDEKQFLTCLRRYEMHEERLRKMEKTHWLESST